MRRSIGWACALALASVGSVQAAQSDRAAATDRGVINVRVRDSVTGLGVPSTLRVFRAPGDAPVVMTERGLAQRLGPNPRPLNSRTLDAAGVRGLALERGTYVFAVAAPGYRELKSWFQLDPAQPVEAVFAIDPLVPPANLADDAVRARLRPGHALFHGHVVDDATGRPVRGARVFLPKTSVDAYSDKSGYFSLYAPQSYVPGEEELPPSDDLIVELDGYKTVVRHDELLVQGDQHFIINLQPGSGQVEFDGRHKLQLTRIEAQAAQQPLMSDASEPDASAPPGPDLTIIDPPNTIRVGYTSSGATCCSSCGLVYSYSLETYVKRGLNDEWISSWGTQSLRSGAVAYRSYGAYSVAHPRTSTYDICSNACCQVNDSDTATSTNTAADRTAGIMLQRSGVTFSSEYSAENNCWDDPNDGLSCSNGDRSCGNCYVGSPANSWPCLYDSVACNHGCFGHGRGESQWGSYRWDLNGYKWNWITDHYYNANGGGSGLRTAYMTSPIRINSISASPTSVNDGTSFTITMNVTNYSGMSYTQTMLGASLYSSATGYISNPSNDKKVTIANGTSNVTRTFTVPVGTGARAYDLITAVWLDANENGTIDSADVAFTTYTRAAYVSVY